MLVFTSLEGAILSREHETTISTLICSSLSKCLPISKKQHVRKIPALKEEYWLSSDLVDQFWKELDLQLGLYNFDFQLLIFAKNLKSLTSGCDWATIEQIIFRNFRHQKFKIYVDIAQEILPMADGISFTQFLFKFYLI